MKRLILLTLLSTSASAQTLTKITQSFDTTKTRTNAVLVVKSNRMVGEYVRSKGILEKKFLLWSMSKTVSALIIGKAIEDGHMKLSETVKAPITVKDLLQMSSGLDWDESYEDAPFRSNVVRMLYGPEASDMGEYILKTKQKYKPGTRFKYSSGDTNLLQWFLKKKLGNAYSSYPWKVLFDPLDIRATFESDNQGMFVGASYIYMSPRDLLKIAQLILQKGKWGGQQIISEEFITEMITASEASVNKPKSRPDDPNHGYQIWLNRPSSNGKLPFKDLPPDSIFFLGHHGQMLGIFPQEEMIILRSAYDRNRIDKNKFFKEILEWARRQN